MEIEELEKLVLRAVELDVNFIDHADIYSGSKSEYLFCEVLKRKLYPREKLLYNLSVVLW